MKKMSSLLAGLSLLFTVSVMSQDFNWATQAGGNGTDQGYDISMDGNGNIYVCGWFTETVQFGSETLISFGMQDIFIACYDTSGVFKWAKQAGSDENEVSAGIVTNPDGYSFITGWFSGTADFDEHSITSAGSYDIYVAKYDPNGNCLWVNGGGGEQDDYGNRITLANDGGCCIGGSFRGEISIGGHSLGSMGDRDILLTHFSANGDVACAKSAGGTGEDRAYGIYQDDDGNYYLTGFYTGTAYFDSYDLTSPAIISSFVAKMNNQGVFQWVQSAGGEANDFARGFEIAPDDEGNLVATGFFSNVLNVAGHSIVSNGGQFDFDIYLLKFDYEGTVTWARNAGGYGMDHGRDLFVLPNGEIYLTGFFSGTGFFGEIMVEASGMADVFMAKYDTYGEIDCMVVGGGLGNDYGYGITGDGLGNLYLTGVFEDDATFGGTVLQAVGDKDIFVAKIPGETSGVSTGALPGGMIIYPNPAKDMLVINPGNSFKGRKDFKYQISDMAGELLAGSGELKFAGQDIFQVDISALKPGSYIVRVFGEGFSYSQKVIIE